MTWLEQQLERLRGIDSLLVDGLLAVAFLVVGLATVFSQDVVDGLHEPTAGAAVTCVVATAPIAVRRRAPLGALVVSCAAILVHLLAGWPEGALPLAALLLTYTVAAWDTPRRALAGLGVVYLTLVLLAVSDTPGLDTLGTAGNLAFFTVAWTVGTALRARRVAVEARLREADERAELERQRAARALAEERLRIAQELHDVVAHSMSVIAVQAGVGAHVLDDRPEQARTALDAISETSRGTLREMRRLLGVLRDDDGERSNAPAPGLADVPQLVADVRAAGVPVTLTVTGIDEGGSLGGGVELSAYRVVQEALTNVIKHAGAPTRVEVAIRREGRSLAVDVVDDGRGAAAPAAVRTGPVSEVARVAESTGGVAPGGHGLLGMRERVEVWGGDLEAGPVPGGGYRVSVVLPCGDPE